MTHRMMAPVLALAVLIGGSVISTRAQEKAKDPISQYAVELRARKNTETDFKKDTRKYGVEIYTDGETNDGLYVSETGSLAVVPAKSFKSGEKAKDPIWRHGLNLKARPAGETDWDKAKKFGLECFRDDVNGNLVYINENGQVAAAGADGVTDKAVVGKPKGTTFKHAMNLKVRKAGDKDWDKAQRFGVEVHLDENNGTLVYISNTGSIAIVGAKMTGPDTKKKDPIYQHGLELSARKVGEAKFGKDTKKYGIEVYQDHANSTLIYITEAGNIAVVPGKNAKTTSAEGKAKDPKFSHGMEVGVRKAGEDKFSETTKKVGIEVYKDENNGSTVYISEGGEIAVVGG
jgi:hypothetical protein